MNICVQLHDNTHLPVAQLRGGQFSPPLSIFRPPLTPPLSLNSSMMMIGVCGPSFKKFSPFRKKTVLGDYINALKKTLDFSLNSYQAVKQHGYK